MICRSDEDRANPRALFNQEPLDDADREFDVVIFGEDSHSVLGLTQLDRLVGETLRPRNLWSYSELDLNHDGFSTIADQDGYAVGTVTEVTL